MAAQSSKVDHAPCMYCNWVLPLQNYNSKTHTCFKDWDQEKEMLMVTDTGHVVMTREFEGQNVIIYPDSCVAPDVEPLEAESPEGEINLEDGDEGALYGGKANNIWRKLDEVLIETVFNYPTLWNSHMDLKKRTRSKRDDAWKTVQLKLNACSNNKVNLSIATIKKRWKHLCNCFTKEKKIRNPPSGSEGLAPQERPRKGFRYYEKMRFITDHQIEVPTTSSAAPNADEDEDSEVDENACPNSNSPAGNSNQTPEKPYRYQNKKRRRSDETPMEEKLLEAIMQTPKAPDRIDGLLILWGSTLRKLPERQSLDLEWRVQTIFHEYEMAHFDQQESNNRS
ncbi:hypothetical protein QAD02_016334 [Eretmocerus hayati]|uniref:Uncharacterized protein n=1 Tax=Eretmocerus hayati TaxID=131215 RepID=A0ACC2PDL2_9HYME|nr:hypothetical protein QAD02_016334 [Eretmocerus hayati]